jgi:hypothetical protein
MRRMPSPGIPGTLSAIFCMCVKVLLLGILAALLGLLFCAGVECGLFTPPTITIAHKVCTRIERII